MHAVSPPTRTPSLLIMHCISLTKKMEMLETQTKTNCYGHYTYRHMDKGAHTLRSVTATGAAALQTTKKSSGAFTADNPWRLSV